MIGNAWKSLHRPVLAVAACFAMAASLPVRAQEPQAEAPPAAPAARLGAGQLDDLVAPIALYPDPLLTQILVASTYPLEVVEAQQWLGANRNLSGTQLMNAARQQSWDPSVQALVAFPDVLARLNQDVQWTTALGNAFLAQQADVMNAVQTMRERAQANGRLNSTPQQNVTTETENGQSAIAIQPADPQVIYVPQYDPMAIWGPPVWGVYPPLYYPAYGFGWGPGINLGFYFGGWGGFGLFGGWGWGPSWFGHGVFVNGAFFNRYGFHSGFGGFGVTAWAHDPAHRLGVGYPNGQLAGRFGAASMASRANMSRSYAAGRSMQSFGGRSSFAGSYGGNRGVESLGSRGSYGQAYGANRGGYQSSRSYGAESARSYGAETARSYGGSGYQSFRGNSFQGSSRGYQAAPRASSPSYSRGSGSGSRSYSGGSRSFNGGARSAGGGRSFGGGHGGGRR
ncbi:MAG: DUF3300 domain-containing protein [Bryobacteraceae bacterium]|jgi:hypothetical protein